MYSFISPVVCTAAHKAPPTPPTISSGTCRAKRPYGYWKSRANLSDELRNFAIEHQHAGRMPTQSELLAAGRADIASAIRRQGKWSEAADAAGLTLTSIVRPRSLYLSFCTEIGSAKPHNYWSDFAHLRSELLPYCGNGRLPTALELERLQRSDLIRAISKHGGFPAVASKLQLQPNYRSRRYWRKFENVQDELERFIQVYGVVGVMPPVALLKEHGPPGLLGAIMRIHGGCTAVAERIGLRSSHPRRPRGYWKSRENRISELHAFVRELRRLDPDRDPNLMPTSDECVQWQRQDLAAGLARNHGFETAAREAGLTSRYEYNNRIE